MYLVYDDDEKLIAFHDSKQVVVKYIQRVYEYHPEVDLHMVKIKRREEEELLKNKDDLYLSRYGKTYVQSGYLHYLLCVTDQYVEDEKFARDILYRILEGGRPLRKKDLKSIKKTIMVIEKLIDNDERYTPTKKELDAIKDHYDECMYYNRNLYQDDVSW